MTIYQKVMYVAVSISVAASLSVANIVFYNERVPKTADSTQFYEMTNKSNDKVLKHFFPYNIVNYTLTVPKNMSYTPADFQKFKGTYLEAKTPAATTAYMTNAVFCGDSLMYGMGLSKQVLANQKVLAWGGLAVSNYGGYTANPVYNQSSASGKSPLSWLSELKPNIVYIMLGTNGLTIITNTTHISQYKTLIDTIKNASSGSTIVLVSCPPWGVDQNASSMTAAAINSKINDFNMLLLELAKDKNCYFLNAAETLIDDSGALKPSYSSGDGIHWSNAARTAFVNYLLAHPVP